MRGSDPLGRVLSTLRRRAYAVALLRWILLSAVVLSAAVLAHTLLASLVPSRPLADGLGALVVVVALVAVGLLALPTLGRLSTMSAAHLADRRAGLADELSTAVWLLDHGTASPIECVQIERARATAARMDAGHLLPVLASATARPAVLLLAVAAAALIALSLPSSRPPTAPALPDSAAAGARQDGAAASRDGARISVPGGEGKAENGTRQPDSAVADGAAAGAQGEMRRPPASADARSQLASEHAPAFTASIKTASVPRLAEAGASGAGARLQPGAGEVRRAAPTTLLAAPDAEIATAGARVELGKRQSMAGQDAAPQAPDDSAPLPPAGTPDAVAPDTRRDAFLSEGDAAGTPDPAGLVHAAASQGEGRASGPPEAARGAARARISGQEEEGVHAEAVGVSLRARLQAMRLADRGRRGAAGSADGPLVATGAQSSSIAPAAAPVTGAYARAEASGGAQVPYAYRETVTRYLLHLNARRD